MFTGLLSCIEKLVSTDLFHGIDLMCTNICISKISRACRGLLELVNRVETLQVEYDFTITLALNVINMETSAIVGNATLLVL